jgi:hypothetical protein
MGSCREQNDSFDNQLADRALVAALRMKADNSLAADSPSFPLMLLFLATISNRFSSSNGSNVSVRSEP